MMMSSREQSVDVTTLLTSWDEMSEHFLAGRGRLLEIAIDWIEQRQSRAIVEVGSGPGTTLRGLRSRLPEIDLVGVDRDPVLRRLHEAATISQERIGLVDADLSMSSWTDAVSIVANPDVVIAVQVLHYFGPARFEELLREMRQIIGSGGALVHLDAVPLPHGDAPRVETEPHSAPFEGSLETNDPWTSWWNSAADVELLDEAFAERAGLADSDAGSAEYHPDHDRFLHHLSDAGFDLAAQHRDGSSLLTIATAR